MSRIEITGQDGVEAEEMDLVGEDALGEIERELEQAEDYLVKCTNCGWTMRRSDPHGCPQGHVAGWSYAGPIPAEEPEGEVDVEPDEDCPTGAELAADTASVAVEVAVMHLFDVQDRLDSAIDDHAEKADVAKTAKKRVESLQEDLSVAVRAVREARTAREPDPEKYPLLDGPRAAGDGVNPMFPKPEAIQPLPPDDVDEFYRRKKRDTRFADLPLKEQVVKILEGAGYRTVLDLDRLHEAGSDITAIRCAEGSITARRAEEVREVLGRVAESWVDEWAGLRPEEAVEAGGEVADA